jgi:hypothetical protein
MTILILSVLLTVKVTYVKMVEHHARTIMNSERNMTEKAVSVYMCSIDITLEQRCRGRLNLAAFHSDKQVIKVRSFNAGLNNYSQLNAFLGRPTISNGS